MNSWKRTLTRSLILAITVALITLGAAGSPAYARPDRWATLGYHTVRSGETLYCIARAYGVNPWAIVSHNGIVSPGLIYPGRVLAIPDAYLALPAGPTCARQFSTPGTGTCAAYHTVVSGENLYRISLHYGVDMWRLAEHNGIYNMNLIRTGQVLCIP